MPLPSTLALAVGGARGGGRGWARPAVEWCLVRHCDRAPQRDVSLALTFFFLLTTITTQPAGGRRATGGTVGALAGRHVADGGWIQTQRARAPARRLGVLVRAGWLVRLTLLLGVPLPSLLALRRGRAARRQGRGEAGREQRGRCRHARAPAAARASGSPTSALFWTSAPPTFFLMTRLGLRRRLCSCIQRSLRATPLNARCRAGTGGRSAAVGRELRRRKRCCAQPRLAVSKPGQAREGRGGKVQACSSQVLVEQTR